MDDISTFDQHLIKMKMTLNKNKINKIVTLNYLKCADCL